MDLKEFLIGFQLRYNEISIGFKENPNEFQLD